MKKMIWINIILIVLTIFFGLLVLLDYWRFNTIMIIPVTLFLCEAIVFLYTFILFKDETLLKIKKYLRIVLLALIPLFALIKFIELITQTVFIYSFSYQYIYLALLVYPLILYLMIKAFLNPKNELYKYWIAGLSSVVTIIVLFINGFLIGLGSYTTSYIEFEERDVDLVLIENHFIFSSEHRLFLKKNIFFMEELEPDGHWTCNDGCVVNDPDAYDWYWIDDDTLVVSGGDLPEPVYFEFE